MYEMCCGCELQNVMPTEQDYREVQEAKEKVVDVIKVIFKNGQSFKSVCHFVTVHHTIDFLNVLTDT